MLDRREVLLAGAWTMMPSFASAATLLAENGPRPVEISALRTDVVLLPQQGSLQSYLQEAHPERLTLVCRGLSAKKPPETSFLLFLNPDEHTALTADDAGYLGTLNLFGGASRDGRLHWPTTSFEIVTVVRALRERGRLTVRLSLTLLAARQPEPGSDMSIQTIELHSS